MLTDEQMEQVFEAIQEHLEVRLDIVHRFDGVVAVAALVFRGEVISQATEPLPTPSVSY